jgi:hypothetical protein
MHMSWLRHIGGRLKSDYRYSIGLVYNTFPLPAAYSGESGHPVRRKAATGSDSMRPVSPAESGR